MMRATDIMPVEHTRVKIELVSDLLVFMTGVDGAVGERALTKSTSPANPFRQPGTS